MLLNYTRQHISVSTDTISREMKKMPNLIRDSFVFHVSFENGTSILPSEKDPLLA